ncbi:YihA family ribosome biogenesis GTP-binding protein [Sulfuriferula sp. AH1]|uniref:ribosome biogenesis GTP-binding protein YihA/YsxC n=1 Tax=Sulfuriferula sp. AH1 TaxID=1985873 RepID=UPI000B3B2F34|nr:ribosome biogenesis GTP-binding protein YihA/YsxC [Sulfuriferula sp. AH1]ARU30628.1 YihA family ribosome biogenesis GTP-binding protein [Sulfuriferula sp. AH1]
MNFFQPAVFYTTVNHLRDLPVESHAEVAFAGRSNAGKSSAINTLANRTRLAFVSKTPGRTQHINYFSLGGQRYLVDLPGYGYAKVPGAIKDHWRDLLSDYLTQRPQLRGLILIMDSRHPLTELDRNMLQWFLPTGKPVHCLLTKSDKLNRSESVAVLRLVKQELEKLSPSYSAQLFSSSKKLGMAEVETVVSKWFAQDEQAEKNLG